MTRADTIARHLNQAGEHLKAAVCEGNPQVYATSGPALSINAAMRCINAAFLECLGGAGEAAGPWVVRVVVDDASVWWASNGAGLPRRQRLDEAARFFSVEEAANMAGLYVEIGHHATVLPLAEAERMEAAAKPTPEPPKPAGWVIEDRDAASGYRLAPLYLAPVVRDHSGVIAQCEEALREWDRKGPHCSATSSLVAVTLTKARNALRGAS